ncbi:MAG: leucine-rich repeat domain-containing protein [Oscillospiraceae bacterium]|nr:leucine-rich repeat domain-containing protein [Oscillospiraceae bacterium]
MKKILKLVIPILVILALLVTGYWFFFRYRKDLTADLLREFADSRSNSGHYSMAIRCYNWADSLATGNADTAMKLAEAYHKSGNYTKTEYVLMHASYDHPEDQRLYEALSRIYVEQDKLLDAQQLLDGIPNEQAREALAEKRPAAPVLSPAADYYSEYISIELQQPDADATCYLSLDGGYPSKEADAYAGPVALNGGQTQVLAVAVNEAGLVSSLTRGDYTIAGVVEDVEFHDEALLAYTQELLHRGNRTIRTDDLWGIPELQLPEGIQNTTDLVYFTGVEKLVGKDLGELDYSFLSSMPKLNDLELDGCIMTQQTLQQIAACSSLDTLILTNCNLTNVSALADMQNLRVLDLANNSINALDALTGGGLEHLEEFYLGHNALTGLPVLRGFPALKTLDLSYNALTYTGGISACTSLERLDLSHNRMSSVTALSALTELIWFDGSNNEVSDVSMMSPCTKLESFLMTDNQLQNIDFLSECAGIREVNIDNNDVIKVPAFQKDCPLVSFSAAHNYLEDLSGLAGLQSLTMVNADYNNIGDISVLVDCPALVQVNVYHTNVHSGGALVEKGVVVNFTPEF